MKPILKVFGTLAVLALFVVSNFAGVLAQTPTPAKVVDFAAKYEILKTNPVQYNIKLMWYPGKNGAKPTQYDIYAAKEPVKDYNLMKHIATLNHQESSNGTAMQYFVMENVAPGTYSFYITATNKVSDNEIYISENSQIVYVTIDANNNTKDYVNIIADWKNGQQKVGEHVKVYFKSQTNRTDCKINYTITSLDPSVPMFNYNLDVKNNVIEFWSEKEGKFALVLNANLDCNKDVASKFVISNYVGQVVDNTPVLSFEKAQETIYIKANEARTFVFTAKNKTNCPVNYSIEKTTLPNLQIDATTGTVVLPMLKMGEKHYFYVLAKIENCTNTNTPIVAYKYVEIIVGDAPNDKNVSFINGILISSLNSKQVEGIVTAMQVNSALVPIGKAFTTNVKNGQFSINLPAGSYILKFDGKGFIPEYFDNAQEPKTANMITIGVNENKTITWQIEPAKPIVTHLVSGSVVDKTTSAPVHSYIEFIPLLAIQKGAFKGQIGANGEVRTIDGAFITKTDDQGNYTIALPEGESFVAHAVPMLNNTKPNVGTKVYQDQFYNEVSDPFQADIINVAADQSGVNFYLLSSIIEAPKTNAVSGTIKDEAGLGLMSNVIAIRVDAKAGADKQYKNSVMTTTDAEGNFTFKELAYGEYVLMSVPMVRTYVPGYYVANSTVTLKWKEATHISVDEATVAMQYDLVHKTVGGVKGGIANLGGTVGKGPGGIAISKGNSSQSAKEPLSGAMLSLKDLNGNIIDYVFSDNAGNFSFEGLEAGTYFLSSDKAGYTEVAQTVVISLENGLNHSADVEMNQATVTSVEDAQISNTNIFPLPANSNVNFEFNALAGSTTISIVSNNGLLVSSKTINTIEGMNTYSFDAQSFANGVYYIIAEQGKISSSTKFVVSK